MNIRAWLERHSLRLLAIRDTPNAIAGGVAIGMFFGFTPLFGLKTLLSIFIAWLTRCNILAAVVAVTLHDVALPFMPILFRWQYQIGFWLMHGEWPQRLRDLHLRPGDWLNWTTFFTVGEPLLVGSLVISSPVAVIAFSLTKILVERHQRKHGSHPAVPPSPPTD